MTTPALRVRIAPKYPAKIQGTNGITVTRTGGVITIGINSFPPAFVGAAFGIWFASLPTDPTGLAVGDYWNNGGTLAQVP